MKISSNRSYLILPNIIVFIIVFHTNMPKSRFFPLEKERRKSCGIIDRIITRCFNCSAPRSKASNVERWKWRLERGKVKQERRNSSQVKMHRFKTWKRFKSKFIKITNPVKVSFRNFLLFTLEKSSRHSHRFILNIIPDNSLNPHLRQRRDAC